MKNVFNDARLQPPQRGTLQYRITGLVFLALLAAVVGPLLFDGEGLPAPAAPPMTGEPALTETAVVERQAVLEPAETATAPAFDELADIEARAAELRERVDDDQFDAGQPAAVRPSEPELTALAADTRVFAVQVGSFAEAQNAEQLQSRLRNSGYEAFLVSVRVRERVMTRVAVGPYLSRAQADEDRLAIGRRFALDAKLMGMVL